MKSSPKIQSPYKKSADLNSVDSASNNRSNAQTSVPRSANRPQVALQRLIERKSDLASRLQNQNAQQAQRLQLSRLQSDLTAPSANLIAQARARKQLRDLKPKTRKLGLMPVGRAKFDAVPISTMISLSNQLGAELGLKVEATQYPGSTANAPATELFCKDLWTLQAVALWVTDGLCYADQFPSMKNIVTRKGHKPSDLSPLITASGHALFDLSPLLGNEVWGPDGIFGRQAESVVLALNRGLTSNTEQNLLLFGAKVDLNFTNGKALGAILYRLYSGVSSTKISNKAIASGTVAIAAACDELSEAATAAAKNCEVRKDTTTGEEKKPYQGEDLLGSSGAVDTKASTSFPWGWVIGGVLVVGGATWYFWPKGDDTL